MVALGSLATVLLLAVLLLFLISLWRKRFVLPDGSVMYADSTDKPGEVLYSSSIPLVGKPDYVLKKDNFFIPVEVKTGKTPKTPYPNHLAQLYAYCLLVEENFHVRPPYGIIRYPEKEFTLEFPENTENYLIHMVKELFIKKEQGVSRFGLKRTCKDCKIHLQSEQMTNDK